MAQDGARKAPQNTARAAPPIEGGGQHVPSLVTKCAD